MYFLEMPHRGDSNEYTQHTIIILKIELSPFAFLTGAVINPIYSGSSYPCLEQIFMIPKMFEPQV